LALFKRSIDVTVEDEDGDLRISGRLADQRFGEDLHIIEAEVLVGVADGLIKRITASMPTIPMEDCKLALQTVSELEGAEIKPGFSDLVRRIVGSSRGCSHLAALLMNIGNVSVQGRAAFVRKYAPSEALAAARMLEQVEQLGILNSCVCWAEDGPIMKRWRERQKGSS
jgi:hypothetical protein